MKNQLAIDLIKRHEGFVGQPYKCPAGKLTIGYGRNIEDNGITLDEGDYLLRNDVDNAQIEISELCRIRNVNFEQLNLVRQAVLIDMIFNLGMNRLSKFNKMFEALAKKDYEEASREMLDSLWARQVKTRAIKLAELMRTGEQ